MFFGKNQTFSSQKKKRIIMTKIKFLNLTGKIMKIYGEIEIKNALYVKKFQNLVHLQEI
jgi:hypothetical protein